MIEEAI